MSGRELEKLRAELAELQSNGAAHELLKEKANRMDELLHREQMMWLERSCIMWLKEGDRNTQFFHQRAVWQAHGSYISKLKNEEGEWYTSPSDMERMASSYFKEVFTRDPTLDVDSVLDLLNIKVTNDMKMRC